MFEKKALTRVPVDDLIARRWSGRAFDPDRLLSRRQILALLEAARWAPSCYGDQPWRYIVCDRRSDAEAWDRAYTCLAEGNRTWAVHAPVLLLAVAGSVFARNGNPNRWGQYDTGAASENLCLQATAMGLMAHQMGGFDADKARAQFDVPEQYTPMAMIAIGYQLPRERIPASLREREFAERSRRPLPEIFFEGRWGMPVRTDGL
jgi:nitroreductase